MKLQAYEDLRKSSERSMEALGQQEAQLLAIVEERREHARKEAAEDLKKVIEASERESEQHLKSIQAATSREAQASARAES